MKSLLKFTLCFLCACSLLGVVFLNRSTVAQQLDGWLLLPRPERLSELSLRPLPLQPDDSQQLAFTVHNNEHRQTQYHYAITARLADGVTVQPLTEGSLTLTHGQTQVVQQRISVPRLAPRVMVRVELTYEGIAWGSNAPSLQKQAVHYWVDFAPRAKGVL